MCRLKGLTWSRSIRKKVFLIGFGCAGQGRQASVEAFLEEGHMSIPHTLYYILLYCYPTM